MFGRAATSTTEKTEKTVLFQEKNRVEHSNHKMVAHNIFRKKYSYRNFAETKKSITFAPLIRDIS